MNLGEELRRLVADEHGCSDIAVDDCSAVEELDHDSWDNIASRFARLSASLIEEDPI